jgi:ABC-type antimicrobial peptide transport system permease subunit
VFRAVIRNIRAHKLRLALSTLAVTLGVAFVVGTFVFTDTLGKTFDDLFAQTTSDVVVEPQSDVTDDFDSGSTTLPADLVETVDSVDGVEKAVGIVLVNGLQIIGTNGEAIASSGAPNFGANWSDDQDLTPYRLTEGRGPTAAGEVAIDSQSADSGDLAVGDTAQLVTPGAPQEATIVGIFRFGSSGNLAGASIAAFETAEAQQLMLNGKDAFTSIDAQIDPGLTQGEVAQRVQAAVGPDVKVSTGEEAADAAASDIAEALSFINIFLLVFAFIALFVGSFIILNTFTMLVAQRTKELALLRAIGASRRQVTSSLLGEALVVGLIGSTVGLVAGIGVAMGIQALFTAVGLDVSAGGLVISLRTVGIAYVVGVVVTLIAAWAPAWRAAKIPPVAAMRDDITTPQRSLRRRLVIGVGVLTVGVGAMLLGFTVAEGGGAAGAVGFGAFLVFMGVITLSPIISKPVIAVLGSPVRSLYGTVGGLAVENAQRNRRRTASTASALMIGLALVSAISVMAASITTSLNNSVDEQFRFNQLLTTSNFTPFSPNIADDVAQIDGVATVSRFRAANASIDDADNFVSAVDPATVAEVLNLDDIDASFQDLNDGEIALDTDGMKAGGYQIGDHVDVIFPTGPQTLTIASTYTKSITFSGYVTTLGTLADAGLKPLDFQVYIKNSPTADAAAVRAGIDDVLASYPTVEVQDQQEFKDAIEGQVNQLLTLIYGLLFLAIVIAVLGIINTLALSVIERTREIGLLRAVGMTRKQLRRMVRLESLVIAVYGALLGVVVGVGFGAALQQASSSSGIDVLEIPWVNLMVFVVLAALVGVLAALWPARRAAKLDVLQAITTE